MKKFSKIGIVGFKDRSADLARALEQIALWAQVHPQVEFCALSNLRELAKKPIRIVKESALSRMDRYPETTLALDALDFAGLGERGERRLHRTGRHPVRIHQGPDAG